MWKSRVGVVGLVAILGYAAAGTLAWQFGDHSAVSDASWSDYWIYKGIAGIELVLIVGILIPPSREVFAAATKWAFVGAGVATAIAWFSSDVNPTCHCLGSAPLPLPRAMLLQGAVIAFSVLALCPANIRSRTELQ